MRVLLLLALPIAALLAEPADHLTLPPRQAFIFKDGHALLWREGAGTTDANSRLRTLDVPEAAILGAFWATSPDGDLRLIRAAREEVDRVTRETIATTDLATLLQANLNQEATVELHTNRSLSGTIQEVLVQKVEAPALPGFSGLAIAASTTGAQFFVLRNADGDHFLPITQIRSVRIAGMRTTLDRALVSREERKVMTFQFAKPDVQRQVRVMSFEPTMRWIPTYRIELDDRRDQARLMLQGELLNEAADFTDATFHLVVGVPNFRFKDVVSPLSLEGQLRRVLNQAAPQLMNQMLYNSYHANRGTEVTRPQPGATDFQLPDELTAGATQDLFVYKLEHLSMKKGERAALPLFDITAPCRHVYTWQPHVKTSYQVPQQDSKASPLVLSQQNVWHQLEMENTGKIPWTTGTALLLQGQQPLAQDMLTYTSPGSRVRVPITIAVDVQGDVTGEEVDRQLKAMRFNGYDYAKVTRQAQLHLVNYKQESVDVEIQLLLGGKVDRASDDATVTVQPFNPADWESYRGDQVLNHRSRIVWQQRLEPGQRFEPSVAYHAFLRH